VGVPLLGRFSYVLPAPSDRRDADAPRGLAYGCYCERNPLWVNMGVRETNRLWRPLRSCLELSRHANPNSHAP
jgi:hypothetical protein